MHRFQIPVGRCCADFQVGADHQVAVGVEAGEGIGADEEADLVVEIEEDEVAGEVEGGADRQDDQSSREDNGKREEQAARAVEVYSRALTMFMAGTFGCHYFMQTAENCVATSRGLSLTPLTIPDRDVVISHRTFLYLTHSTPANRLPLHSFNTVQVSRATTLCLKLQEVWVQQSSNEV